MCLRFIFLITVQVFGSNNFRDLNLCPLQFSKTPNSPDAVDTWSPVEWVHNFSLRTSKGTASKVPRAVPQNIKTRHYRLMSTFSASNKYLSGFNIRIEKSKYLVTDMIMEKNNCSPNFIILTFVILFKPCWL